MFVNSINSFKQLYLISQAIRPPFLMNIIKYVYFVYCDIVLS